MSHRYYDGPRSDHFDGERFFNPGIQTPDKSLLDILRWKLTSRAAKWPERLPYGAQAVPSAQSEDLRVTFVGHASLLVQVAGVNLLLDPIWSERASPISWAGPKRHAPPGIAFEQLPKIDAVLVTHNHYDHLDIETLRKLWQRDRAPVFTPLGNEAVIHAKAGEIQVHTADWGEHFEIRPGIVAHVVPANHWSSRNIRDRRMALWCGFVLETPQGNVYFAGDTGYGDGRIFRELQQRLGEIRLAVLPIGAYAPRWFMESQHVNPEEAVRIFLDCGADSALGMHWGTFQLTDEAWDEPPRMLAEALASHGIAPERFVAACPGDVWLRDTVIPAPAALE